MSEVRKFKKKPVIIEAMFLDADDTPIGGGVSANDLAHARIAGWMFSNGFRQFAVHGDEAPYGLAIWTLEGDMVANPGDWIIRGAQGEFYPCKPDIFSATYEEVSGQ